MRKPQPRSAIAAFLRPWPPSVAPWIFAFALMAAAPSPCAAGPPYLSDDPEPTDQGHWEIYTFAIGAGGPNGLSGEAGLDLNYGPVNDVQLTADLPLAFGGSEGFSLDGLRAGPGDLEVAVKYRFLHQKEGSWLPDLSFFPRVFIPTAPAALGGAGRLAFLAPVWGEKDVGPWSVFGGGGYQINPGAGQRDFWQGGLALSRALGERLSLGGEVYGQTSTTKRGGAFTAVDAAATYKIVAHWTLMGSLGPAWRHTGGDGYVFYLALKSDY